MMDDLMFGKFDFNNPYNNNLHDSIDNNDI
jgi:hypothetical protein